MGRRIIVLTLILPMASALRFAPSRRTLLQQAAALGATAAPMASNAQGDLIDVYFGCGCFWHVQHEFVEAEKKILGRRDTELTAMAGYAGGRAGAKNSKVCYHNAAQVSDYGALGHAEVVGLRIPASAFPDFAKEYFALFDKNGNRPDQLGDRGGEYRNLVGVPGGADSVYAKQLVQASIESGDKLDFSKGKGDDPDARAVSFLMDTNAFPFFQAEPYHQFHDGFAWGEDYPASYNRLSGSLLKAGAIKDLGCPNGMLGVGIAGL